MAYRAKETFVVGTKEGRKMQFIKNGVVPADVAKGRDELVYDDGEPVKRGPGRPRKVETDA